MKKTAEHRQRTCRNFIFNESHDGFGQALGEFENNIAHESIAHDDIHCSFRNIAAFDVADKIGDMLLQ